MRARIFVGDIADVEADAICSSTNPRLSLMMGTGAALRERGGHEILRACEVIVRREGTLPPGSARVTPAGSLRSRGVIHCVASDQRHRTSEEIVAACVRNALECAERHGYRTVAMPVFASGHARMKFRRALETMAVAAREAQAEVIFVIHDEDDLPIARSVLGDVPVARSAAARAASGWMDDNPFG
jgi:O-acetyl-ADP-ribose deacetylase (regulator of RNase III)